MDCNAEIVHSLAKWKRYALKKYGFSVGEGLYTDMVAIRRDEDVDNIHSIYVDQWDWEKIITKEETATVETLMNPLSVLSTSALRKTEKYMAVQYDYIEEILPGEYCICHHPGACRHVSGSAPLRSENTRSSKQKGAVFLMQIGEKLTNWRAPRRTCSRL